MNNEELVDNRLTNIEHKIDKLSELLEQTHLQEYRIAALEQMCGKIQDKIYALEHKPGNIAVMIVAYLASGIGTILLGYIALKVGLK